MRQDGWAITYRVDDDPARMPTLEFYATNRRTNDRHVVIAADGSLERQDARGNVADPLAFRGEPSPAARGEEAWPLLP
jgi:hypothetical protein